MRPAASLIERPPLGARVRLTPEGRVCLRPRNPAREGVVVAWCRYDPQRYPDWVGVRVRWDDHGPRTAAEVSAAFLELC